MLDYVVKLTKDARLNLKCIRRQQFNLGNFTLLSAEAGDSLLVNLHHQTTLP